MMRSKRPVFSVLSREDAVALLSKHHVGRLAFTFHDRVDLEPISYVYANGWIYMRTSPGTKLTTLAHHPWVAFEVDEVDDLYDWRSVVARGAIYFLDPDRSARDQEAYDTAVALMQSIDADMLTELDPTPERRHFCRVHADEIVGRRASTR